MAGRKRKPGHREPNGRHVRVTGHEIAPAAIKRQQTDGAKLFGDKTWGTRIWAHLNLGEITGQQAASAIKVRDIYAAYEQAKRLGRDPRSPDPQPQSKGDSGRPEPLVAVKSAALKLGVVRLEDLHPLDPARLQMELILAIEAAWLALQKKIDEIVPPPHTAHWRAALEDYCVHDREPVYTEKPTLADLLDDLARFFGIASHKKGGNVGKVARALAAVPGKSKPKPLAEPKHPLLIEGERTAMAVRDREKLRRQKARA
jgi:hypothetical protein